MAENAGFDLKALDGDFVIPFGKKKIRIPKKVAILAVAVILGLLAFFLLPKGKESKEDKETVEDTSGSGKVGVLPGIDNGDVGGGIDKVQDTPQILPPVTEARIDVSPPLAGFGGGDFGGGGGSLSGGGFGGDSGGGAITQSLPPPQSFQDRSMSSPVLSSPSQPLLKPPTGKKLTPQKLGALTGAKLGAQAGLKLKKPSTGIHKTKSADVIKAQKSTGAPYQGVFGSPAQKSGKAAIIPKGKGTGAPVLGVFGSPAQKAGKASIKGKTTKPTKKGVGFGNVTGSAYKTGVKPPGAFGGVKGKAGKAGTGFGNIKGKATVKPKPKVKPKKGFFG